MPDTPFEGRHSVDDLESVFDTTSSTEERIYRLLVQRTDGVSAPAVAEEIECSKDTARKYLDWFAELGVAIKHEGRPMRYERNEEYFTWRYVNELADTHSLQELRENVVDIREQLERLRDRYDADDPATVDLVEVAESLELDIETVWDDLSTWASLEDELRLHDRARRRLSDRAEASAD